MQHEKSKKNCSSYHFDGTEARYHADTDSYTIRVHLREQNADVLLLKSDPESESFDRRIDAEIAKNGKTQYCSYDFFIEVKDYTVPLECQFSEAALLQRGEEPDRSFVITFGLGASRREKYYLDIEGPDEFKQFFTGAYIQRYFRGGLDGIAICLESGEENLVTVSDPDGIKMEVWVTSLYEGVNTYVMEYWSGPPQDKRGYFEKVTCAFF